MKYLYFSLCLIVICTSCTPIEKKQSVYSIIKGQEPPVFSRFLSPNVVTNSLTITGIDGKYTAGEKVEVSVSPGAHVIHLACAYYPEASKNGLIKTFSGELKMVVEEGLIYQLKLDRLTMGKCNALIESTVNISPSKN